MPNMNIDAAANTGAKNLLKAGETGFGKVKSAFNDFFDIEDPVGVQAQIVKKQNANTLKSNKEIDSSLSLTGKSSNKLNTDNKISNNAGFYTDSVKSVIHKDPDGKDISTVIVSPMVLCKKEFFEKYNNYEIPEDDVVNYEKRLCPNIEDQAF